MKTRRIAVVILLALVLAALLPLSAAADAYPMLYIYGQVRVGTESFGEGVGGATLELYRNGALVWTVKSSQGNGDFGLGVSPIVGSYKLKLILPSGGGLTPRETWFQGQPIFTPDPTEFSFRWTGGEALFGPIVFWCDGEVVLDPSQPMPWVYIHGKAIDTDTFDPDFLPDAQVPVGIAGVTIKLQRGVGKDTVGQNPPYYDPTTVWTDMATKATGDRGYFGFGVGGTSNWYKLVLVNTAGHTNVGPTSYVFLLPPLSSSVGPFIFSLT